MKALLIYLLLINATSFILMLADKRKAQKNQWRISESTLIGTAIIGGALGCLLGMRIAHHKTLHPKFYIGVPFILVAQIILFLVFRNFSL